MLGICNGFQILCEAGLLPGVLRPNRQQQFLCADVTVTVESTASAFAGGWELGEELVIPVKHGEGSWYGDAELVAELEARGQIAFRYADDVNGAVDSDRRRHERGRQRARPDAAPRARGRPAARPDRRRAGAGGADRAARTVSAALTARADGMVLERRQPEDAARRRDRVPRGLISGWPSTCSDAVVVGGGAAFLIVFFGAQWFWAVRDARRSRQLALRKR